LHTLTLDGWNFNDLLMNAGDWLSVTVDNWWDRMMASEDTDDYPELTISHYRPHADDPVLSLDNALPIFRKTARLKLDDVEFAGEVRSAGSPGLIVEFLKIKDLDHRNTALITSQFSYLSVSLEVVRCPLDAVVVPDIMGATILEGSNDPTALRQFMTDWQGRELILFNCPGFDDTVLEMLSAPFLNEEGRIETFISPDLNTLIVHGKYTWTVPALQKFVKMRNKSREFSMFAVEVDRGGKISKAQTMWFAKQKKMGFRWGSQVLGNPKHLYARP
jgi:hypothetical protein